MSTRFKCLPQNWLVSSFSYEITFPYKTRRILKDYLLRRRVSFNYRISFANDNIWMLYQKGWTQWHIWNFFHDPLFKYSEYRRGHLGANPRPDSGVPQAIKRGRALAIHRHPWRNMSGRFSTKNPIQTTGYCSASHVNISRVVGAKQLRFQLLISTQTQVY